MRKVIIAYVPVLHSGYMRFFRRHPGAMVVIDPDGLELPDYIRRDIRAIPADVMVGMIQSVFGNAVAKGDDRVLRLVAEGPGSIIMPNEDVSIAVAEKYFNDREVFFDNIFLRWNMENVSKPQPVLADSLISDWSNLLEPVRVALSLKDRSSDWWRQIGAVLVRDGKVILKGYNKHQPSEHTPYIVGDPRTPFNPGERIDLSSAHHAERAVIAQAAREGISTKNACMVVTTFPCPACAMDIVEAGITTVYYVEGYSLVDAQGILRANDVKIVQVVATPLPK